MNLPAGELLAALSGEMARYFQAVRLYPDSHPERAKRRLALEAAWTRCRGRWPSVSLDFQRGALRVAGEPQATWDSPLFRDLRRATSQLEARSQSFDLNSAGDCPLAGFLESLANPRGGPPEAVQEPLAAPSARSLEPVPSPPPVPEGALTDPCDRLRALWSAILYRRQYPENAAEELVRYIARQPSDGLLEPAQLWVSEKPADRQLVQALNVTRLVYLAARSRGLGVRQIGDWMTAAFLADIGMAVLPPDLAERPERLRPTEFQEIRRHPRLGATALLATPGTPLLAAVVAFEHHLRPDGQGYPQTARDWKVSPASALFQVADTYASLRSHRPFRPALEESQARALLRRLSGRWFDGFSVEFFLEQAIPQGCIMQVPGVGHPAFSL